MAGRNSFARTLHDLGLGIWFGGSLMGAVGLNAAAKKASEPTERLEVANAGWARWTPVNAAGIGAYLLGGAVLMWANKGRLAGQAGVGRATAGKNLLSLLALGATAYSRVLGQRLMQYEKVPVEGGTTSTHETPPEVRGIQQQLKLLQYAIPAHVGGLIAISAVMGEQQRPTEVARGVRRRFLRSAA
jgi:putative copper export protein